MSYIESIDGTHTDPDTPGSHPLERPPSFPSYSEVVENLASIMEEMALARDLQEVMTVTRRAVRELTGADGASFILLEGNMCHYAEEDAIAPLWKGKRFPIEQCISGWVMANRKPVVVEDIYDDERIPRAAYLPTFVKSLVLVPIRKQSPVGAFRPWPTPPRRP
ncbi:MAG: GAF domain-containing protein [Acidobacteriota bacterium]